MAKKKTKKKAKKEPVINSECKVIFPFYSPARWNNWIEQVKDSGFELKEGEENDEKSGEIFVNMEDDIILACLKVIAKYDNKEFSPYDALDALDEIKSVVLTRLEPISESIDMMIESLQTSLIAVFASCEYYISGGYDTSADLAEMIKGAVAAEEKNDPGTALSYIVEVGASVLAGRELSDDLYSDLPYGLVAEWMDGIDSISAAMVGDDSYKFDEPDIEE
jgi:hypothetical protein